MPAHKVIVIWRQARCCDIILKWLCLTETNRFDSDKNVSSGLHRNIHSVHYRSPLCYSHLKTIAMLRHNIEMSMLNRDKLIRFWQKRCYIAACIVFNVPIDDNRGFETLYWNDHAYMRHIDPFLTKRCPLSLHRSMHSVHYRSTYVVI